MKLKVRSTAVSGKAAWTSEAPPGDCVIRWRHRSGDTLCRMLRPQDGWGCPGWRFACPGDAYFGLFCCPRTPVRGGAVCISLPFFVVSLPFFDVSSQSPCVFERRRSLSAPVSFGRQPCRPGLLGTLGLPPLPCDAGRHRRASSHGAARADSGCRAGVQTKPHPSRDFPGFLCLLSE